MAKIWSILQFVFGLLLVWVLLDSAIGLLWVAGFLSGIGGWLDVPAVEAYIVFLIIIFELVKGLTSD
ncbi:MAG: hypothetical protein ACTSX6_06565 [Candidatus Heimdallarchaeaceae archaeon]